MPIKTASSLATRPAKAGDRRRRSRVKLSCFILVRPLEPDPEYFESLILTSNSCRNGLSFETHDDFYRERMRLLITFPYSLAQGAINQDYISEVVRTNALPGDRCRVAVRFLTTAKLSLPPTTNLRSSNVWNALWQRAKAKTGAGKVNGGGLRPAKPSKAQMKRK